MECIVCYETEYTIDQALKHSFIRLPCESTKDSLNKHIICFKCFIMNINGKCPMCRFNYKSTYEYNYVEDDNEVHTPHIQLDTMPLLQGTQLLTEEDFIDDNLQEINTYIQDIHNELENTINELEDTTITNEYDEDISIMTVEQNWISYKDNLNRLTDFIEQEIYNKGLLRNYQTMYTLIDLIRSFNNVYNMPDSIIEFVDDFDMIRRMYLTELLESFSTNKPISDIKYCLIKYIQHELYVRRERDE